MKITIATSPGDLNAPVAPYFGWAASFEIFDTETEQWKSYSNPAFSAGSSVEARAARFTIEQGVGVVIDGKFGSGAAKMFAGAGVQMFLATRTAPELLTCYREGQLKQVLPPFGIEP